MCHHLGFIDIWKAVIYFRHLNQTPSLSILVLNPAIYHHALLTSRWDRNETKFNPFMMKWFPLTSSTLIVEMNENMSNDFQFYVHILIGP